jgi:hypothetical protein
MAFEPEITLDFGRDIDCPDCAQRNVQLPQPLPDIGDDFDWDQRDYDSYRLFMLEELAASFPDRSRWTPADVEVAVVEALASVLDQLSDMLDRTASEAFLETARRPDSLRRLLKLIGYDALELARNTATAPFDREPPARDGRSDEERFDTYWLNNPSKMEAARNKGPQLIHDQHRMVTISDYRTRLEEHPLVLRAHAWEEWGGSWPIIRIALIAWRRNDLDRPVTAGASGDGAILISDNVWNPVVRFHAQRGLYCPSRESSPTIRTILRPFLDAYRTIGQEVRLQRAVEVGIQIGLVIQLNPNYFHSEVRREIEAALGTGSGGFFEHGRLQFGEDLYASDLFETLMQLEGVEHVCLSRFKRLGSRFPDQSASGRIVLDGLEVAVCDNNPRKPDKGYYTLALEGGRKG